MLQSFKNFLVQLHAEIGAWRQVYFFRRPLLVLLAVYCVLLIILKANGVLDRRSSLDPSNWTNQLCAVTGIVSSHPDARPTGCVYILRVETVEPFDGSFVRHSANGPILLQVIKSTTPFAAPGDRVRAVGRLQQPRASTTPGAFDYQDYLSNQGIHTLVYTSSRSVQNLGASGAFKFMRWGWRIKQREVEIFKRHLNEEQTTVLSGLVVGNRPRFNPEIKRIFIESGTMHVLVASGSNVAFVIALWFLLARLFGFPRWWALASALGPVWVYVLIAGADAPIIRAGLMGTIGIISHLTAREDRPYHALGLSAFIILGCSPNFLFDVGFEMSFLTVFGLIYFLSPLEEKIQTLPPWWRWPLRLLAASFTAQIWLIPLTAHTFGRFFPLSVLSNIVVVPWAGLGLTAGLSLTLMDIVNQHLCHLDWIKTATVSLVRLYVQGLIGLAKIFSGHLGWSVWVAAPHILTTIGFYVGCFSAVGARRSRVSRLGLMVGVMLIFFGFGMDRHSRQPIQSLTLTWIDTGKRLTTLIQTPDGKNVLMNPGPREPYDSTERVLMPFLAGEGITQLDAVLITHPNVDQTSGLESLQKWVRISTVVVCGPSVLWISFGGKKILLADSLPLKTQDYLLAHPLKNMLVIQTHFPQRFIWRDEFLRRYKPKLLIETHTVSAFHPSVPPWEDVPLVIPQKIGWYRWKAEKPSSWNVSIQDPL